MPVLLWSKLLDFLRVQWRQYKSTFYWLLVWLCAGIVIGIITLIISNIAVDDINYRLIDGNILNATAINSSLGSFVWQRILSLVIPVLVVLIFACLSRVTALMVFPVVLMHGYWCAVAVWWTFFYYSLPAILVLIFYILWLVVVTAVLLAGLLWALQCGEQFRNSKNCDSNHRWANLFRGLAIISGVAVILGFIEYLVFWTVLGKIVYKAR